MVAIRFTGNYEDLSTDRGYQFKFYCEKCHNGYMSSFKTSTMGMLGAAARAANDLFGGIFGRVADTSYEVQRAVGGSAHDGALKEAVDEIAPIFKQCTRCGNWVCEPVCWNKTAGLCENCAPDLDEEMAAAQDMGDYYRVPPDLRDLNYGKFVEEGERRISDAHDYNSHNTRRLDIDALKQLLLKLDFIGAILAGRPTEPVE